MSFTNICVVANIFTLHIAHYSTLAQQKPLSCCCVHTHLSRATSAKKSIAIQGQYTKPAAWAKCVWTGELRIHQMFLIAVPRPDQLVYLLPKARTRATTIVMNRKMARCEF